MRQRGFTLIELVVVIALIGLAYTLLPKLAFGGVSGPELKSNVRAVATGLRLTLDGFNSTFSFEWAAAPSLSNAPVPPQQAGALSWSNLYGKLRELSRLTQ